ncbi:MAG: response regulator [Vicinamibacterales bacterium]|nr:response regulator [Vicinamibacterales bacterium]
MSQTLLLADDSVTIQRVIELTFEDEDIQVIAVGDGQQAIDRIKSDPPDIVLADTGMPERDGYDVAMFIKEDPALAHIPVVLLTGAFEPVDEDRARQVGSDAVLVKPFEPQVVISRVRALLRGQAAPVEPATSRPVGVAPSRPADADNGSAAAAEGEEAAPGLPAQADASYAHDSDETETARLPPQQTPSDDADAASPSASGNRGLGADDPLGIYLDQMDEAFDRLSEEEPGDSGQARSEKDNEPPAQPATSASAVDINSLEGALSALEGALDKLDLNNLEDTPQVEASVAGPSVSATPSLGEDEDTPEAAPTPPVSAPEPVAAAPGPAERGDRSVAAAPPTAPTAPTSQESHESMPRATPPSLADAFASLLAAEQGDATRPQTVYPWPGPASLLDMSEELIERVTERVIDRLSDGANSELVSQVVARVAEKLVREEIERIKDG